MSPSHWETLALCEIADVERGKFSVRPRNDPRYYGGSIPFVQTGDVASCGGTLRKYSQTLNEDGLKISRLFPKGTILVTIAANIGEVAITEIDVACPDSLVGVRAKSTTDAAWLRYALQCKKQDMEEKATRNAQKNINLEVLRPLLMEVPPLPEQRKIAEILSEWDRGIEKTDNLLRLKRRLRLGLAQTLLIGQLRLAPGKGKQCDREMRCVSVPSDWDVKLISDIADEVSARNPGDPNLPVLSCTKHRGLVPSLEYFGKQIFSNDTSNYRLVKRGDFAYATNHIEEGSIGYQDKYDEALVSPIYTVFKLEADINPKFLFLLLKTNLYRHFFETDTSASVNRRGSLRWDEFSKIPVPLPPRPEQDRIAECFAALDSEIELLERINEQQRKSKQALMQNLLTGKIRVKA